jgi:hypothetical protein
MGFSDWVKRSIHSVREEGYAGAKESAHEIYGGAWRYLGWHVPRGRIVYEADWDALVVLDACRVDLLREVAEEYPFVGAVEARDSVGSMSEEWMAKTFTDEYAAEMRDTAYVTANAFSGEVLDADSFRLLDEVWRDRWDDELGVVPPEAVTDRAVSVGREHDPEYLLVHYMQPHHPLIGSDAFAEFESDPFGGKGVRTEVDALRRGEVTHAEFWAGYRDNLRRALDSVGTLLSNLDADRVVLTADHGEAFGEWGIYGHPAGCLHPAVRTVPWAETTAEDTEAYAPELDPESSLSGEVEDRLRDMGYL